MRAIESADILIYDYLANPRLLAHARADAEKIYVGKKASQHTLKQDDINQLLFDKAATGALVVRLKGGDPYIFGRGSEEMEFLVERGINVEVIPGIPAAIGAAAYAGIPLTDRRHTSSLAFITGHEDPTKPESSVDWEKIATGIGTIVFYMGVKNLPYITRKLMEHGRAGDTPVSIVEWATMPRQRVVTGTLETISRIAAEENITPPALSIVGSVNDLRGRLAWFDLLPLKGKRIVVTRSRTQASALAEKLSALGADVIEMPTIDIVPPESWDEIDNAVRNISEFDWVVFTSVNGVDYFMERVRELGGDARSFAGINVAAIGPATTARLRESGIRPDFQPDKYVAESIFEGLAAQGEITGRKFLMPRADIAREQLPLLLREAGAEVTDIDAYRTVPGAFDVEEMRGLLDSGSVDVVTFTSSSTARNFADRLGKDFVSSIKNKFSGISIGPVTSGTMRESGFEPAAEAVDFTIPGLIDTIINFFSEKEAQE